MAFSLQRLGLASSFLSIPLLITVAQAQVSPDGTLNTTVTQAGNNYTITNGTSAGPNLYHSFGQFSIPTGGSATFDLNATPAIRTIFSRVTGGSVSNIDGLLRTLNSSNPVSLFLMNPAGILFGANAQLKLGGSFIATTANSIKFADGTEFSAVNPTASPLLTVSAPIGLQMGSIASGSTIVNRGNLTAGQDLILVADRLDLQGQLVAGRDLILTAQNTVQIRDTVTAPLIAKAGRDLTIQGNQGVDIFTLNHPRSQFHSVGNLSLISDGTISGDAHFASGGAVQIRSRSGQPANFTSLYDPIISSTGDVDIAGSYTGASLLIESLGSVRIQGDVTINAPDTISTFVGGDAILGTRPGFIIRSGQTTLVYGSNNQNNPPAYTSSTVPSGITLLGDVVVQPIGILGGVVNLLASTGDITVAGIDTSNRSGGGNGGTITLNATNGNLTTNGDLDASALFFFGDSGNGGTIVLTVNGALTTNGALTASAASAFGNSGTGGTIALTATGNLISNGTLDSSSFSTYGNSGIGGAIALSATNGDLTINDDFRSTSTAFTGNSGTGGAIALNVTNGNLINNGRLSSASFSYSGNSGTGGAITLGVTNGNLTANGALDSSSFSLTGITGTGGAITLSTTNGALINNTLLNTSSTTSSGKGGTGGTIALASTNGDLTNNGGLDAGSISSSGTSGAGGAIVLSVTNGNLTNNGYVSSSSYANLGSGNGGEITLSSTKGTLTNNSSVFAYSFAASGNSGDGGAIALDSTNSDLINTSFVNSSSLSGSGNSGNGGAITLTAPNGTLSNSSDLSSFSYSDSGNSGNGGAIALTAYNGNILGNGGTLNSFSVAPQGTASAGGAVSLTAQNRISGLQVLTTSSAAQAGAVSIIGRGNLAISDTVILTSKQVTIDTPVTGPLTIPVNGTGRSGDVNITSAGNLALINSRIESDTKGSDPAGNVTLTSPGFATFSNSQILSSTSSNGNAGNITITTGQGISLANGSRLSAITASTGKAGDITFTSPTVVIAGDAQLTAATQGSGQGGTITVNAPLSVNLEQIQGSASILSVETSDAGKAGDIVINTPSLTLADNARIVATATATATNTESGGSITLNASQMKLSGIVGVFAETQGQAPAGTLRLNPYANDPTLTVFLAPQSQISASTNGSGNGGNLSLSAPDAITLSGAGKLTAETSSSGNAGNISVTTRQFTINGGVELSASTTGSGKAGDLTIAADRVNLSQGARISSNTSAQGAAGDITFNLSDQLVLKGTGTGLFTTTTPGSTGNGGNITVIAKTASLQDGAAIAVGSLGSGAGGNIAVAADRLTLDTHASLTAETASTQGGNITLNVRDILLLRHNSLISTTAGTAQAGGNGGNLTINTPNGFIVGVRSEDSDIRANAFTGNGGKISITAQGIFGLRFQPKNTPNSDITASSQFGFSGTVQITNLSVDPTAGIVQLPVDLVDPTQQIATDCQAQGSRFVVTGRGGFPLNPLEETGSERPWSDIRAVAAGTPSGRPTQAFIPQPATPILEATGFHRTANGDTTLIATSSTTRRQVAAATCAQTTTP